MKILNVLQKSPEISLYKIKDNTNVISLISSSSESRAICNDPCVCGLEYTGKLQTACYKSLQALKNCDLLALEEKETVVLNILRGGLNFCLREALHRAFNWNSHTSAFISAQRARDNNNPEDWYITENSYQKVYLPKTCSIVFGDVVATGTSLEFALQKLLNIVMEQGSELKQLVFFTIGGKRSEEILENIDKQCREKFKNYKNSIVLYLEGCFDVADVNSKLSVKYTGTDLIRSNSILAPEFIYSQLEEAAYPLERCTIYDAGSRAFWLPEYFEDVIDYWEKTLRLSENGMDYKTLLKERFPEILGLYESKHIELEEICHQQLEKLKSYA